MNIDNTLYAGRPTERRSEVEIAIYDKLDALSMDYKRADHDHADTMEDCLAIEKVLGAKICKNLFLANRQRTKGRYRSACPRQSSPNRCNQY